MILYATFAIATGIIIGYISLAVGWMIGKAIMKGSGGVGGRRYQITAAALTYCAVSMAAVPIGIHYAGEQADGNKHSSKGRSNGNWTRVERQEEKNPNQQDLAPPQCRRQSKRQVARPGLGKALVRSWPCSGLHRH